MHDSFAAYCSEKRKHTFQTKSDIELLKEVNLQLVQNTTDFKQQVTLLQQEHFNDIQCIDTCITGIENATNSLAQSTQTTSTTVNDIKSRINSL